MGATYAKMAFVSSRLLFMLFYVLIFATIVASSGKDVADCFCGFYDRTTEEFFTDAAIVYFNETSQVPADVFIPEVYENQYEKGWNSRFRQGFNQSNIVVAQNQDGVSSNTSLELHVNPSTPEHLVVGGAIQTSRRDMFYGSFRTLMRSPRSWSPGSALSMTLHYNDSQTVNLDLNVPSEDTAWVAMLSHEEFPDRNLGVNYSVLSNSTNEISPWDYTEFRIDWTEKEVIYYIGGKPFRTILKSEAKSFLQTPTMLRIKHWSVGNWFTMQGPPLNRSAANVGWVRMFFNSSLTTEQDEDAFDRRCSLKSACATEDMTLRGSSPYKQDSTIQWVQAPNAKRSRTIPTIILIITGTISTFLIANALLRRIPQRKSQSPEPKEPASDKIHIPRYENSVGSTLEAAMVVPSALASANDSSVASYYGSRAASNYPSRAASYYGSRAASIHDGIETPTNPGLLSKDTLGPYINIQISATTPSQHFHDEAKRPRLSWREFSEGLQKLQQEELDRTRHEDDMSVYGEKSSEVYSISGRTHLPLNNLHGDTDSITSAWPAGEAVELRTPSRTYFRSEESTAFIADPPTMRAVEIYPPSDSYNCSCTEASIRQVSSDLPISKIRIDYLAGLLAFSCLLVTAIQFVLTFSPAAIDPGADVHYKTESWARKVVSAYFLNLIWVGPFLITSARFLVSSYLEHGDLLEVAHKIVGRPFRLLLPILAIAMLEYFFMDSGATNWLEYLPSVTWSTWAFTTVPNNFGYFLSEILELAYLIPNAAPQITFNYCTGVLWTIPVQLQNSWVALLGVIIVRQIKTPWKRFGYYSFCMLMHWYALSWGSYFYFGIMLTDLEITYNYRKWLYARPVFYYLLIALFICMTAGGLSLDMVTQVTKINYAAYEYGIHPDIPTGLPIIFTGATGYPQYYVPKLNGIVFAFGLQSLIELSPCMQSVFSFKMLLYVYPHIYTIYLIHGFIFWSLGSTVFLYLSAHGFQYWVMVTVVAVCCYATLFLAVFLLTPIVNTLGNGDNIWVFAHEVPSPRRPTLYPFPNNFLFVRQESAQGNPAEVEPGETPVVFAKGRNRFKKFVLDSIAVLTPRWKKQPCQPAVGSLSRKSNVVGRSVPARSVGWRTGGLSKSVVTLKRNNSNMSRLDDRRMA